MPKLVNRDEHEFKMTLLTPQRLSSMHGQMDGIESAVGEAANASVMVMAASNCPWDLDEAFRRRLEKRIFVPLPDEESRELMYAELNPHFFVS